MNDKPNARELLKEARAELAKAHDHLMELTEKLPMQYFGLVDGNIIQSEDCLIGQLDAYLAAPSESAMEMAMEIRAAEVAWNDDSGKYCVLYEKSLADSAALIERLQRRVPRKMLDEIIRYTEGMVEWDGEVSDYEFVDKIAAKHGVEPF